MVPRVTAERRRTLIASLLSPPVGVVRNCRTTRREPRMPEVDATRVFRFRIRPDVDELNSQSLRAA